MLILQNESVNTNIDNSKILQVGNAALEGATIALTISDKRKMNLKEIVKK